MRKKIFTVVAAITLCASFILGACSKESSTTSGGGEKEFRYAMSGLYKPFNFKENDGKLVGFDVEIGEALAKKMGMKPVPVTNPWETLIQGLKAKKYDVILGSMAITEERLKAVNFSNPYYRSGAQTFVTKKNNSISSAEDLKGKKVGVVKASTFKTLVAKQTDQITEYDSDITALMDLEPGRVDAVITDQMVGLRMIKEGKSNIKEAGKPLNLDEMGIAIRKDDKEMVKKVNKALDEIIKDGTYEKISKKWFGRNILGEEKQTK
ncbi:ABC transporter substrate-binding protein [Bacillus sp. Xin]|uniref:ABC transporter substrate-binding protein n=1 Tax=unclassified Bacillus (in: firmicutes) TaxID=185979 RepID=UPI001574AA4E|nr:MULTISPECIES: ABC transporter substrate-binding protein [unclassified Bacillus (in: firmicutes)]MBC6972629.1 ABC transporter substrate-binding protein [Bacillus sp. Xin]NSW37034.1 transporter substrate-binding domain-containing protein [Bacillus sp. Xin1]